MAQGGWIKNSMPEEKRRHFLPKVVRGEFLGATALSEPDTGSDLASAYPAARCATATTGCSPATSTGARSPTAPTTSPLFARTSPRPRPTKRWHVGISCFLIEKPRGTLPPGINGAPIPKIGYFGWKTFELAFDKCRLPGSMR
jgi:alkylation response protein AidB-like acyl-CoA dehydrogenase